MADNQRLTTSGLPHGGRVRAASLRYGIPRSEWLDLSTGINPRGYPVVAMPPEVWQRLPEDDDMLLPAAARYYGSQDLLPVAGSQPAIQTLPQLRARCRVAVLSPGYAEHVAAWSRAGHEVIPVAAAHVDAAVTQCDVVVLIHPGNPGGEVFDRTQLDDWHARLVRRGGWLVIDEAFIDATPAASVIRPNMPSGLIVLRSLGKFFGLAGARVGFVAADAYLRSALGIMLGPWTIAGPSRFIATQALSDRVWQRRTREWLKQRSLELQTLLTDHGLAPDTGTALFQRVLSDDAGRWHEHLARAGIWTRIFDTPHSLRLGVTATDAEHARLRAALVAGQ